MLKRYTISQLILYIKTKLTDDMCLQNISVEGEIGNFTNHSSGHWYFSLKDNEALINCVMFKYSRQSSFVPQNGDKVILYGNINLYDKSGQLQIQGIKLEKVGNGDFYAQFEKMKQKLTPLGLFDNNHKKVIPKLCKKIAIITGSNTAALQDVLRTINIRWPMSKLYHISAIMQGEMAPNSCINALKRADELDCDVILLVRGGGSVDDLFCFNDEQLAYQIYNSKTPIITGIGHEIDFTIADLVADYRAATPTAAAQKCTPDQKEYILLLNSIDIKLNDYIIYKLNSCQQDLDLCDERLNRYSYNIANLKNNLYNYSNKLEKYLETNLEKQRINLLALNQSLRTNIKNFYNKKDTEFMNLVTKLDILSPLKTINRGYTITLQDDLVVKYSSEIDLNKVIKTKFIDGIIISRPIERK